MIKIAHVEEAKRLQHLPQEVVVVVEGIAEILDTEYGVDRQVDSGDGGFILVIQSAEELEQLKDIYIDIDEVIAEFTDTITVQGADNYTNSLILLSSDFSVSLIPSKLTSFAMTPGRLSEN
jgi:hypothetical protein